MHYKGSRDFTHRQKDRIGILLVNLGTPDAPTVPALRKYLAEFLWDPRVVEVARPLWWLILHGIILRVRPKRSAAAYASIWTDQGSPLLLETLALKEKLNSRFDENFLVEAGMRYGNPSVESALDNLCECGARRVLLLPLYPQYSAATSGSTFDAVADDFSRRRWIPELRFITHYHDFKPYVDSCSKTIENHWQIHGKPEKLLLSYHGVPKRYLDNGDPYHCECHKTSRLIAENLGLSADSYLTTFQSRFGREEWLKPYTDETLKSLPSRGIEHVQVFCPGFAADCLETLEEIDVENRAHFLSAGGKTFSYIPALNASESHVDALEKLIEVNLEGWEIAAGETDSRQALARQKGASD